MADGTKATPGPWKFCPSVEGDILGIYPDTGNAEFPIAVMPDYRQRAINEANGPLLASAPTLRSALALIDGEAPASEPRDQPTVGLPPNYSRDIAEYVAEIVREAFEEGKTRGRWEAAKIARAALSKAEGK